MRIYTETLHYYGPLVKHFDTVLSRSLNTKLYELEMHNPDILIPSQTFNDLAVGVGILKSCALSRQQDDPTQLEFILKETQPMYHFLKDDLSSMIDERLKIFSEKGSYEAPNLPDSKSQQHLFMPNYHGIDPETKYSQLFKWQKMIIKLLDTAYTVQGLRRLLEKYFEKMPGTEKLEGGAPVVSNLRDKGYFNPIYCTYTTASGELVRNVQFSSDAFSGYNQVIRDLKPIFGDPLIVLDKNFTSADILPAVREGSDSYSPKPATGLRIIYDQGLTENVKKEHKRRSDKPIVLTDDNGFMRLRGLTFAKKGEPLFQVVDIIDKMPSRPYLVVK